MYHNLTKYRENRRESSYKLKVFFLTVMKNAPLTSMITAHKVKNMEYDKNSLTPLKNIIDLLLNNGALPFNPNDAAIWKVWDELVGDAVAKKAHPVWIKDKRLRVVVTDPIWLQELKFLEKEIREELNEKLGRTAIMKIEFRAGSI